jgi:hypothetical protein
MVQMEVGIAGMTRHEGSSCVRFISSARGVTFYWSMAREDLVTGWWNGLRLNDG